jgi:predicted Rossmann fold flavoprotein
MNQQIPQTDFDVIVVGGGPAGMMAAGRAAELGAKVALIEKNDTLGKKLLITGGGRCNITNAEFDVKKLVAKYGVKGKALYGAFARFGVENTLSFFHDKNLPTKVEAEQRAFPESNKAEDVWKVMVQYLKDTGVTVISDSPVKRILFNAEEGKVTGIKTKKQIYTAQNYVIATGGKSRPETGSTGEGMEWMKELGHAVEESDPALVPVTLKDDWVKRLSGVSFKDAKLTVFQDGKKQEARIGKILLTHFGISGPLVLNMSKIISELFKYAPVNLELDLYPEMDLGTLDKHFLDLLSKSLNKQVKNNLGSIVPPKMILTILQFTKINPETTTNSLTKTDRMKIVKLIKAMPMTVSGFLGVEKAVVTSGGVSLKEIDFKTMQSKLYSNLYLAGDILNFDRPSGGYSLQICWTTGFLAGENAGK